jgi:hypothetical protein
MSHKHFCDMAGHPWQCESSECICICQKPMEQGDHNRCSIELRACSEHGDEQVSIAEPEQDAPGVVGSSATRTEPEGWGRLEPIAPEIEEKLSEWFTSDRESIGFCCLCGHSIPTENDFIPDTFTHNCEEGRLFEEKKHRE